MITTIIIDYVLIIIGVILGYILGKYSGEKLGYAKGLYEGYSKCRDEFSMMVEELRQKLVNEGSK